MGSVRLRYDAVREPATGAILMLECDDDASMRRCVDELYRGYFCATFCCASCEVKEHFGSPEFCEILSVCVCGRRECKVCAIVTRVLYFLIFLLYHLLSPLYIYNNLI